MTNRLGFSIILGLAATVALFYLMQALIAGSKATFTQIPVTEIVNFVRVKVPPHVTPTKPRLVKPPPAHREPRPVTPHFNPEKVGPSTNPLPGGEINVNSAPTTYGGASDGPPLPVVKVQPIYPQRALSRGLSGWVIVQFTVTAQGRVASPFVVQNCAWIKAAGDGAECHDSPNAIFDSAALRAAKKFKYRPRVVDGHPMATMALQNKISFELNATH